MKTVPLAFEPGTSWTYGAGIDWAAEVVRIKLPVFLHLQRQLNNKSCVDHNR